MQRIECIGEMFAKNFLTKSDLKQHMLMHSENKPYQRNVCNKDNLSLHMIRRHRENSYGCDLCEKQFSRKQPLTGI